MSEFAAIRSGLGRYAPRLEPEAKLRAAVALVLRAGEAERPEVLFIERAQQPGDPWSGHMAFPGGRVAAADPSPRSAAERETREEVGIDLAGAELLGRLDDLEGRHAGRRTDLVISGFVYRLEAPAVLRLNHEVEAAFWVPLRALLDPARHVELQLLPDAPPYPGIRVGEAPPHVVWGLTYRFVELFLAIAQLPLPDRWHAFAELR